MPSLQGTRGAPSTLGPGRRVGMLVGAGSRQNPKGLDPAASRGHDTRDGRIARGHDQSAVGRQQARKSGKRRFEGTPGCGSNRNGRAQYSGSLHVRGEDTRNSGEIRKPPPGPSFPCQPDRHPLLPCRRAENYGRIATRCHKDLSGHCCSGQLAMRSSNGQAPLPYHQPAEQLGIAQDRNAEFCGSKQFGIVGRNGAAMDYVADIRAHVLGVMSAETGNACLGKRIVAADPQI